MVRFRVGVVGDSCGSSHLVRLLVGRVGKRSLGGQRMSGEKSGCSGGRKDSAGGDTARFFAWL